MVKHENGITYQGLKIAQKGRIFDATLLLKLFANFLIKTHKKQLSREKYDPLEPF